MATPDVKILVGNLGGAAPSGHSAVLIRKNLQTALSGQNGVKVNIVPKFDVTAFVKTINTQLAAHAVKVNVTPVVNGTGTDGKTTTTKTTNFTEYDKATVSARAMTQQTALLTQQKIKLTQETHKENMAHQQNMHSQQQAAQAAKTAVEVGKQEVQDSKVRVQLKKEETAILAENAKQRKINTAETERANAAAMREQTTLASMKMELAKFNQYLLTLNPKALTQYAGQINNIKTLLGSGIAANGQKAAAAMKSFKAEMVAAGYEGGNAFALLATKMKTYFSYFVSSTIIMGIYSAVSNLISNVKDLDEAMTDLRIVTGNTRKETDDLLKSYNALAQKLGTTTVSVSEGAVDWLRQGYSGDEAEELLTQSMTLSIVGDMESADATDALTAAMKGYGLAVEEASSVVDKFMTVDMAAASSSEDLALALAKTAANAKIAGLSLDDVIGQLAVVSETMKEDGSSTGTFYNTMLSRMGAIKSGRLIDPESEESLSDVETTLNRLGIALRDEQGNFRNFGEVLNEVGDEWKNYSEVNKRAIAQSFAGTRQQTRFITLMEGWEQAAKYSAIASDSAGKSAEKLAIYQESVEAKTARATAAFEKFSTSLLDSRLVGGIMDLGTGIFNFLSGLNGVPARIALVTAAVAALYSAIKSLGAMNIGKNFIGFFTGLG